MRSAPTRTAVYAPYDNALGEEPRDGSHSRRPAGGGRGPRRSHRARCGRQRRHPARAPHAGNPHRLRQSRDDRRRGEGAQRSSSSSSIAALTPGQQRNLEKAFAAKVLDRTGSDPRDLRRARGDQGRPSAGRARPSLLPEEPARALLDAFGAPARWRGLPRRSRRDADGGRPAAAAGADRIHHRRSRAGEAHARAASQGPQARALSGGRPRRLHQRRQVDAVQPADRRRGARQGHAVRDARPDHARDRAAVGPQDHPFRYGRLHLRTADDAHRRFPGNAGRGDRRRSHPARARHRARGQRGPAPGCRAAC